MALSQMTASEMLEAGNMDQKRGLQGLQEKINCLLFSLIKNDSKRQELDQQEEEIRERKERFELEGETAAARAKMEAQRVSGSSVKCATQRK